MIFDAIVLSGGRSARLDGVSKASLEVSGRTLLDRAVEAVSSARTRVVVGPVTAGPTEADVVFTREDPLFSGPAAAIAAGVDALLSLPSLFPRADWICVIACDMPNIAPAVEALLAEADAADSTIVDGALAVDESGRPQLLAGIYRSTSLRSAVEANRYRLVDLSVRSLLGSLALVGVAVPAGSTDDVDTWADASRLGAEPADFHPEQESKMRRGERT